MQLGNFPNRTMQQHKTEWLYYRIVSDYTGHTPYFIYECMCKEFLRSLNEFGDECVIKPTSLNTQHHNFYMEQIRMFFAEFDLILPDPKKNIGKEYTNKVIKIEK